MLNLTNRQIFNLLYGIALPCPYNPVWRSSGPANRPEFTIAVGDQSISRMAQASAIYRCQDPEGRKLVIIPATSTPYPDRGNVVFFEKFPAPLGDDTTIIIVQAHLLYTLPRQEGKQREARQWRTTLMIDQIALALVTDDHVELNALITGYTTLAQLAVSDQVAGQPTADEVQELKLKELMDKYWPRWQCHKQVKAVKIAALHGEDTFMGETPRLKVIAENPGVPAFYLSREFCERHKPAVGGYVVYYDDGYISYSPGEPFESGYTLLGEAS